MRKVLGTLLILTGIVLGLVVGLYLMVICGIIQIVDGFNVEPDADGGMIAWGAVRALFGGTVGSAIAVAFSLFGASVFDSVSSRRRREARERAKLIRYR